MPTPRDGYYLADGTRVPSTTTVISRFKDSGALMHWAWKQGKEGRPLYERAEKAAEVGTTVHAMVEANLNGIDTSSILEKSGLNADQMLQAVSSYNAYMAWEENFGLEVVEQEIQFVSEEWRFGGTPDVVGRINGQLCLVDWKTSGGIYTDMLVQLAAYRHLWDVNRPDTPLTGGSHLIRFSKSHGDFSHHYFPRLDEAWEQFTYFRRAYDIDLGLKERAK